MNLDLTRAFIAIMLSIFVHASVAMLGNFQFGKAGSIAGSLSVSVTGYTSHAISQSPTHDVQSESVTKSESTPQPESNVEPSPDLVTQEAIVAAEVAPVQEQIEESPVAKPVKKPRYKEEATVKPVAKLVKKAQSQIPLEPKPTPVTTPRPSDEKTASLKQQPVKSTNTAYEMNASSDTHTGTVYEAKSKGLIVTSKPDVIAIPLYHLIPKPPYPSRSRDLGETGMVIVAILVAVDGSVTDAYVSGSSGFPLLDGSALSTVKTKWRFKPATNRGKAVESWVRAPINFNIK